MKRRKKPRGLGFVVNGGTMTSLGSAGATFVGHGSTLDVDAYRSTSGIGRAHSQLDKKALVS